MEEKTIFNRSAERKSESRTILDKFYSVQFFLNYMGPTYLFKLRDIPLNGLCILVKEDSSVLKELKVGDILDMEYNPPGLSDSPKLKRRGKNNEWLRPPLIPFKESRAAGQTTNAPTAQRKGV